MVLFPLFKSTIKVWVLSKLMNCKKDICQIPRAITSKGEMISL